MLHNFLSRSLMLSIEIIQRELKEDTEGYYDLCKDVEDIPNNAIDLDSKKVQEAKKAAKYLKWCLGEQKDRYKRFNETAKKIDESAYDQWYSDKPEIRSDLFSNYKNLLDLAKEVVTAWEWVDSAAIKLRRLSVELLPDHNTTKSKPGLKYG